MYEGEWAALVLVPNYWRQNVNKIGPFVNKSKKKIDISLLFNFLQINLSLSYNIQKLETNNLFNFYFMECFSFAGQFKQVSPKPLELRIPRKNTKLNTLSNFEIADQNLLLNFKAYIASLSCLKFILHFITLKKKLSKNDIYI